MPTLNGTAGGDNIKGDQLAGDLDDIIHGLGGNDRLRGLFGDDQLFGDAGDDRLEGGAGDDRLDGGLGSDRLDGEAGNDDLTGGPGNDTLDGGAGFDRVHYSGPSTGYRIGGGPNGTITDLFAGDGNDGSDSLRGVERAVFSDRTILLAPNVAPVGVADSYATDEDVALVVAAAGVLANDSDFEGDRLAAILATGPAHGTIAFTSDGSFAYTPDPDFNGIDSFAYQVNDGLDFGNVVTVTLTVNPVNDAPVASADLYILTPGDASGLVTLEVGGTIYWILPALANDFDADGDSLEYGIVADFAGMPPQLVDFTNDLWGVPFDAPLGLYTTFYFAFDGQAFTGRADVTVIIDTRPVAAGDSATTAEDVPVTIDVLANDGEGDPGQALTPVIVDTPGHGTVAVNADGTITYTPGANYNGADSFSYKPDDGLLDGNTVTVDITVNPVNDNPEAVDDFYVMDEDTTLVVAAPGVLANDFDVDGDTLSADALVFITLLGSAGGLTFSPAPNFNGTFSFLYVARDGLGGGDVATVRIRVDPVNDAPLAVADSYSVDEDGTLVVDALVGVLANDEDVDGDALAAGLVSDVAHGTLTLAADGSFTYTPDADYDGPDSFSYKVNDGTVDGNMVTVSLTVAPVNDPPVGVPDIYTLVQADFVNVTDPAQGLLANDRDVDGDTLSVELVDLPQHYRNFIFTPDGTFAYVPDRAFVGTDGFTYRISDGTTFSDPVTVALVVEPGAPVAVADHYSMVQDQVLIVIDPAAGLFANDSDPQGDTLSGELLNTPSPSQVFVFDSDNGTFAYVPPAGFVGTVAFSYRVSDGNLFSDPVTVTIEVTAAEPGAAAMFGDFADPLAVLQVPDFLG